ncbi:MAG: Rap1a/Tai family immunity protein, partial [Pseudomonadota bacterium]
TVVLGLLAGPLRAVERDDFNLATMQDLLDLCMVIQADPLSKEAIHFCVGYIEGAMDYHDTVVGKDMKPLVCKPNGTTRNDAVGVLVAWGQANRGNATRMNEPPVIGVVRALE